MTLKNERALYAALVDARKERDDAKARIAELEKALARVGAITNSLAIVSASKALPKALRASLEKVCDELYKAILEGDTDVDAESSRPSADPPQRT